uniref:Uncharacterized protein n=1 Tax=Megaselia scalaris TaxID=36166 RepID=T1H6G0_MEGSC
LESEADSGKIIWQENKDFSSSKTEHQAYVPVKSRSQSCIQ